MNFQKVQDSDYSCYDPLIVINDQKLRFVGDDNPPMFKYLGMWIQSDLKEDIVVGKVEDKLVGWLNTIDSAPLDGRMKVWIVNFHVCSMLAWLLMVQNWSETTAAGWQKHIHRKFRKWLGSLSLLNHPSSTAERSTSVYSSKTCNSYRISSEW